MSKSKEPVNTIDEIDPPPAYTPAATDTNQETPHELPRINPRPSAGAPISTTVTRDQVIAHLKFLAVLSDLRDTIASTPDLFGIPDAQRELFGAQTNEAQIRVKEKRWAVYTARAVERYEAWWNSCLGQNRATIWRLYSPDYGDVVKIKGVMEWDVDMLPPIDVLMVLHSHMLNPRGFLEDTIRYNQQGLWSSGFPWTVVNACIDNNTLTYAVPSSAVTHFEEKTSHKWDNLSDDDAKTLVCPRCMKEVTVPWTTGQVTPPLDDAYSTCNGYADRQFFARCTGCKFKIDHERLKVAKFRRDVEALLHRQYPMPGTLYNLYGVPTPAEHDDRRGSASTFPNRLIKATAFELVRYTDPQNDNGGCRTVRALRDKLEDKLNDRGTMKRTHANLSTFSVMTLHPEEKVSFRRMMSSYWDNLGPFALDLVGAVIRQGTFVTKMDELDWLHSPTLNLTVTRFIKKYEAFFSIMADNPQHMAVPTLDVDLAWHTHQLGAARYYLYSAYQTSQRSRREIFIDHDDKVDENRLSDGFEWTSKMYKTMTGGELYSECLCWYCEAVRTPDSRTGGLFSSSSSSATDSRADQVRDRLEERHDETITHPDKNPHISAHNAVRPRQSNSGTSGLRRLRQQDPREVKILRLRSAYQTAERRAAKRRGRGRPLSGFSPGNPVYPMAWGIPMYVEPYAPYMCDPGMHEDAYVANPGCMALQSGAHGNCVAGTCGGAVAAGRCGGRAGGACGGGCAGGDGGAGAGACGGGGGSSGGGSSGGCGGGGGGGGA